MALNASKSGEGVLDGGAPAEGGSTVLAFGFTPELNHQRFLGMDADRAAVVLCSRALRS
jgi:hypothetical protein